MPQSAKGCLKLLVKDNTATLLIKLYYASTTYDVRLGTLITCWTTHIHSTASLAGFNHTTTKTGSSTGTATLVPPSPIMTSIFPERDSGCYIQIHEEEGNDSAACRIPLGYRSGQPLNGLMSLDTYIKHNGADRPHAKLLVCVTAVGDVVTGISIYPVSPEFPANVKVHISANKPPLTVPTKPSSNNTNRPPFLTLPITITDTSTIATLSLSADLFPSFKTTNQTHPHPHPLKPLSTILLLTSPRLHPNNRHHAHPLITLTSNSGIEINPLIPEADSLRRIIQRKNRPINRPFPLISTSTSSSKEDKNGTGTAGKELFTAQNIAEADTRLQFTFASLCDFISDYESTNSSSPLFPCSTTTQSLPTTSSSPKIAGYLPILLTRINLTALAQQRRLFSMPCHFCFNENGMPMPPIPIYSNSTTGKCRQCGIETKLRVNPDVVGGMADESGGFLVSQEKRTGRTIKHSPLLLSDQAWTDLLGRTPEELAEFCREADDAGCGITSKQKMENAKLLRYLEQRLTWMRVVLAVGWLDEVDGGVLAVLGVVQ
jgi:hypothetical protein